MAAHRYKILGNSVTGGTIMASVMGGAGNMSWVGSLFTSTPVPLPKM